MKHCQKPPEPATLATYRQAQPQGTWEQMRNDPHHDGQTAYSDIKHTLTRYRRGLCAYCEMPIADGLDDIAIDARKHEQRVEHFHPKDDHSGATNWAFEWANLWAVCLGGSQRPPEGVPLDTTTYLPPLPENLSCDAFKEHQITTGELPPNPEGWLLAPQEVPAFPLLFQFSPDGAPEPGAQCASVTLTTNNYADTTTLVAKTIEHLNLGCTRLNRNRCIAKAQLEKRIRRERSLAPGASPREVLLSLARDVYLRKIAVRRGRNTSP